MPTPVAAGNAQIAEPLGMAIDSMGNVYFTSQEAVFRLDKSGFVSRVAGNSRRGFGGDSGLAVRAQLASPVGLATDVAGNLYIADCGNHRVRRVSPAGMISTVAGLGGPVVGQNFGGDGGPATSARLSCPTGLAVDNTGSLFIVDSGNERIRKVAPNGQMSTIAGTGVRGFSGDGGPATNAQLSGPKGIAVDQENNIYVTDRSNGRIRKISPVGIINTIAGDGSFGYSGDGGPAINAAFNFPSGLALDAAGNLYVTDFENSRVRRIARNGLISTVAGSARGYSGDGGPSVVAQLNHPDGIVVDGSGNLYIGDAGNNRIRMAATNGSISNAVGSRLIEDGACCGKTVGGYSGDGGSAVNAELYSPSGLALDPDGNIYVADTFNNRIRRISRNGVITTFAGSGPTTSSGGSFAGDGGPATLAKLSSPTGLATDKFNNLYFTDTGNHRVRRVSAAGIVTTVAGGGASGSLGDGGLGTSARLQSPRGIVVDAAGNLYIADSENHRIRRLSSSGVITTVAGTGTGGFSGDGGPATAAQLLRPAGIAIDASGNLYVADTQNHRIRRISSTGIITTVAGNGQDGYSGDGDAATAAKLNRPSGVFMDNLGSLYIADSRNHRVRRVSASGTIVTIAGSSELPVGLDTAGRYSGDDGPASASELNFPAALAGDNSGNLFLADADNNAVRALRIALTSVTLSAVTNAASGIQGPLSPGEIVAVYGSGMGPTQLTAFSLDSQGRIARVLAGTRVLFNDSPAPLLYSSASQISAIVPYSLAGDTVRVSVEYQGQVSDPITVPVARSAPGIFTLDSSGRGQAAALNGDGSVNGVTRPSRLGQVIVLYATGEGQSTPTGIDGKLSESPLPRPLLPVSVTIAGQPASVEYAGGVPGIVAGLLQVNARIPDALPVLGAVPVTIVVGTSASQAGVSIVVSSN